MYLKYFLDESGKRVYTLKKTDPSSNNTFSAHPARFSPEDKYSKYRIIIKKRFGIFTKHKIVFAGVLFIIAWKGIGLTIMNFLFVKQDDEGNYYLADPKKLREETRENYRNRNPLRELSTPQEFKGIYKRSPVQITKTKFELDDD